MIKNRTLTRYILFLSVILVSKVAIAIPVGLEDKGDWVSSENGLDYLDVSLTFGISNSDLHDGFNYANRDWRLATQTEVVDLLSHWYDGLKIWDEYWFMDDQNVFEIVDLFGDSCLGDPDSATCVAGYFYVPGYENVNAYWASIYWKDIPDNIGADGTTISMRGYNTDPDGRIGWLGGWMVAPSPIPVPPAVWLFGTALIGLAGFNRRRKSA